VDPVDVRWGGCPVRARRFAVAFDPFTVLQAEGGPAVR
jgi:hypothetical protein